MTNANFVLLARTAAHLQPSQVTHRARLRAQRAALHRFPPARWWLMSGPDPAAAVGWPDRFRPLDARLWRNWPEFGLLREGRIELLGMTRRLTSLAETADPGCDHGDPSDADWAEAHWTRADWEQADWEQPDAPALWRFHLHYWDWAWRLASEPDRAEARARFAAMWRSWQAKVRAGRGDAWLPYPAALRAWSFCGLHGDLVAGSPVEAAFLSSLSAHAGFLRRHLETRCRRQSPDQEPQGARRARGVLRGRAAAALGAGHPDRSAGRAGAARRRSLRAGARLPLPGAGRPDRRRGAAPGRPARRPPRSCCRRSPGCAAGWAACWPRTGEVPLLNDGYPVPARCIAALRARAAAGGSAGDLPDTGLVRAAAGGWRLLADVGAPCPEELPAHAHADTLSCLVHVDGVPLLVDTGTSTYAAGAVRGYERSTAAHNTVGDRRRRLHRGVGGVPGCPAGPGHGCRDLYRARRRADHRGRPRRVPAPARPAGAPPPLDR